MDRIKWHQKIYFKLRKYVHRMNKHTHHNLRQTFKEFDFKYNKWPLFVCEDTQRSYHGIMTLFGRIIEL